MNAGERVITNSSRDSEVPVFKCLSAMRAAKSVRLHTALAELIAKGDIWAYLSRGVLHSERWFSQLNLQVAIATRCVSPRTVAPGRSALASLTSDSLLELTLDSSATQCG